jgi:hypothetical protein
MFALGQKATNANEQKLSELIADRCRHYQIEDRQEIEFDVDRATGPPKLTTEILRASQQKTNRRAVTTSLRRNARRKFFKLCRGLAATPRGELR